MKRSIKRLPRLPKKYYEALLNIINNKCVNDIISRRYVKLFLSRLFDLKPSLLNNYSDLALASLQEDGYIVRIKRGVYKTIKTSDYDAD